MSEEEFEYPPKDGAVRTWVLFNISVSVINVVAFLMTFIYTKRYVTFNYKKEHYWSYRYVMAMRYLPIPFLANTVWRSFLPSLYNSRRTIIDVSGNVDSVVVARFLATIGEICWASQIGLALYMISSTIPFRFEKNVRKHIRRTILVVSILLPILSTIGQVMSIAGLISTNYLFVVVEESLWAVIFFLSALSTAFLWIFGCDEFKCLSFCAFVKEEFPYKHKRYHDEKSVWVMRIFIRGMTIFGVVATPYMVIVDVPKWYSRYLADEEVNKQYSPIAAGFYDAVNTQNPSQETSDWDQDFFWMSAYFSVAAGTTIFLMFSPGRVPQEIAKQDDPDLNVTGAALVTGKEP